MVRRVFLLSLVLLTVVVWLPGLAQSPGNPKDEQAIRQSVASYSAAFNKGDPKALLAHWAADADYIDDSGTAHKGRAAIGALFGKALAKLKGYTLTIHIQSLRFIRPDVAIEDGTLELVSPAGQGEPSRYTAVWVKTDGKWLISSARDLSAAGENDPSPTYRRLRELEWLVGDWSHDDERAKVSVHCRWGTNKSFLQVAITVKVKDNSKLKVQVKDGAELKVSQWIGWDPVSGQIKSWLFDSRGGHGEGYWTRDGNRWVIAASGVLPDGSFGSSTNVWQFVDDKTAIWQSTGREVDDQPIADAEIKLVRTGVSK